MARQGGFITENVRIHSPGRKHLSAKARLSKDEIQPQRILRQNDGTQSGRERVGSSLQQGKRPNPRIYLWIIRQLYDLVKLTCSGPYHFFPICRKWQAGIYKSECGLIADHYLWPPLPLSISLAVLYAENLVEKRDGFCFCALNVLSSNKQLKLFSNQRGKDLAFYFYLDVTSKEQFYNLLQKDRK